MIHSLQKFYCHSAKTHLPEKKPEEKKSFTLVTDDLILVTDDIILVSDDVILVTRD